jgi:hypothetical protein
VKFLMRAAEDLNSSIDYVLSPSNHEKWGDLLDNWSFTGLTGDLVSNRTDTRFAAWPLHPSGCMMGTLREESSMLEMYLHDIFHNNLDSWPFISHICTTPHASAC